MDAAAKADPLHARQKRAEFFLNPRQLTVEQVEIGIFAIIVDHEARDPVDHTCDLVGIPFTKA